MAVPIVTLTLLVACGGGGKSSALTPKLVGQANKLCGEWTNALKSAGASPALGDVTQMERFTRRVLSVDQDYTARFKALPATPPEQKVLVPVVTSFDTINGAEGDLVNSAQRGDKAGIQSLHQKVVDETTKVDRRLTALHLNVCAT